MAEVKAALGKSLGGALRHTEQGGRDGAESSDGSESAASSDSSDGEREELDGLNEDAKELVDSLAGFTADYYDDNIKSEARRIAAYLVMRCSTIAKGDASEGDVSDSDSDSDRTPLALLARPVPRHGRCR